MLEGIFGWLAEGFAGILQWFVGILPASPIQTALLGLPVEATVWLGWLNWLCPVGDMVFLFGAWLVCMGIVMSASLAITGVVNTFLDTILNRV